jgi:hypothetical protein
MRSQDDGRERTPALNEATMSWAGRGVWAVCVAVYLTVFIGGMQAGSEELELVARAAGFTVLAAILGRIGLNLLAHASLPLEVVPMDDEEGRLGSRIDMSSSPNLGEQEDQADKA